MYKLMKFLKSSILRNIGLYTILNLVNSGIPFLLLPILTNKLNKEEYGTIDLFNNIGFILMPLVGLNVGASVIRFYYDREMDKKDLLSTSINFTIISSLFFVVVSLSLSFFIEISVLYKTIFFCSLVYACFSQVSEILLSYFRAIESPKAFGIFRICKTALDFGITVCIILFVYVGWEARVYSAVFIAFLCAVFALLYLLKKSLYTFSINKTLLKEIVIYSSPLIIHSVSGYIMSFSDRFIILHFYDLSYVGLYSVAYQIGMIMSFISNSFNQAWTPFLFKKLSTMDKNTIGFLIKANRIYFLFLVIVSLVLYFSLPFIYKVFIGKDFVIDFYIVLIVIISYCFNGFYKMLVNYMFYFKKTGMLSLFTLTCSIVNVFVCWFLVPLYGLMGAALATLISFICQWVFVYVVYFKLLQKIRNGSIIN
ncbi:lipopolysaccharide biosynthesis protein [Myroides odoratimimus]|uniref:lipopolysaccharide biosynthesis protein n=1 Tax=Myroides odoratimimus TaxID=76832 RepID=UPI002576FAD8|nr:oligosaccharide flippase family protein [Myroides odoratimimus]MDM1086231.1 oligosaccharide flippase family protein [Myroides odoratimimus]